MSDGRSARLLPAHQQYVAGPAVRSEVLHSTHMKRLMTNVQRRYTSWNYKMWETVAYRGFEVRGRFPSSSHLKTYLFNIFMSYQRGWCKRKTIPQRGTNGCKLSQMSHKDLDRGTKRSSPSDDRRGRRGVAEKGRK